MKIPAIILAVIMMGVLAAVGIAYSGLYDVSASSPHSSFTKWFLSIASHASIERQAKEIEVPNLDDDALVLAGVNDFDSMCAGCHGAPGRNPEAMGQGLNPPAPDLAEEAAELTPGELFWVTKNGIRMTGMPAWGVTHADDSIWPVVAFMIKLPELDESAYQALLASAAGHGHHAPESADDAHSHDETNDFLGGEAHNNEVSEGATHEHTEVDNDEEPVAEPDDDDHSTHEHD